MKKSLKKTIRVLADEIYVLSIHNYISSEPPSGKFGALAKIEEKLRKFKKSWSRQKPKSCWREKINK